MIPANILKNIPLFRNLDEQDLALIAARLRKAVYTKGSIIFREGDLGDTMLLVESGQLAVMGQAEGETIAFVGPGNFVGETALLLGEPRTASLQVIIDAQVWILNKEDFETLVITRQSIAREMLQEIGRRLVTTTHRKGRLITRRVTALWGDPALILPTAICRLLKGAVGVLVLPGAPLHADADVDPGVILMKNPDLTEASLAEGLGYQVEVFRHVVILLPEQPGPLSRRALALADTIVSLGQAPDWITPAHRQEMFYSAGSSPQELQRLARRLTNRTVGLALSSGGTRGLVHVGVLKVLREEAIPVDLIAGTSGGALFGALFAAGWSYNQVEAYIRHLKTLTRLSNWDVRFLPRSGMVKGRKARDKYLAEPLHNITFADLQTPLYIVAADIFTGEEVVFDSGSLADAIRASASIPILGEPWHYQNRYFLDGGIVNPLPADVLRRRGADIVIASSVIQSLEQSYSGPTDRCPNILQTVFNIFSAMEAEVVKKQLPLVDVLIQHQVSARSTLDFDQVDALIESGEQATRRLLPEIRRAVAGTESAEG